MHLILCRSNVGDLELTYERLCTVFILHFIVCNGSVNFILKNQIVSTYLVFFIYKHVLNTTSVTWTHQNMTRDYSVKIGRLQQQKIHMTSQQYFHVTEKSQRRDEKKMYMYDMYHCLPDDTGMYKELFQFSHRYLFARTIRSTMSWESVVSLQIFWWQLLHI